MITCVLMLLGGIFFLYWGASFMIDGTGKLSRALRIRALIISLTFIAFGTSLPELATSIAAAIKKSGYLALGNVIGSNVTNIGLILGLSSLIRPIKVEKGVLVKDILFMFGAYTILFLFSLNGSLSRLEGFFLLLLLLLFLFFEMRRRRMDAPPEGGKLKGFLLIISGIAFTCLGAYLMVRGGVGISKALGVSELIIGLSMVAFGTSLPELSVSLIASLKRRGEISVGNVVGSNIFNILGIAGAVSVILPLRIERSILFIEYPIMFLFGLFLLPFMRTGYIGRLGGFLFLLAYIIFIGRMF